MRVARLSCRSLPIAKLSALCFRIFAFAAAAAIAIPASAQLLDSVNVTNDGANAVVRIKFAALIQYIRHAPASEGSVVQVYFQITAGDEASRTVIEEQRRPNPTDLVPSFTVTYPSQPPGLLRRLDIKFASPVRFRLRPEDASSIVLLIPLSDEQIAKLTPPKPEGIKLAPSSVQATPTTDVERNAAELARDARSALESGDFERAVVLLNRLLNLPPNAWSQEAQEQIGLARERLGETGKAKAEYELYLKLYPDGPGADRIRQQLAALAASPIAAAGAARTGAVTYWGSVSQYYYGGQSRATTTTTTVTPATGATTIDTASLSGIDQSQLANNIDLTTRYRDAVWDNRIVVRDAYFLNLLKGSSNSNQLNAAYAETRYQPTQLMGRFGRQSATTGGVLGLFDGAVGSWGFAENWRVGGVVGQPVNTQLGGTNKTFYGANVEAENVGGQWGGNAFAIRQNVSGYEDRTGIGGELRYFDTSWNLYSLLDYDPTFRATSIAMVQANVQFPTGTSLNVLFDYRRSPTLQLTNALVVDPTLSINDLVKTLGLGATRDLAKAVTPVSRVAFVGVTQQLSPQWQIGGDFRVSSLSETPALGTTFPGAPSSGNIYTYTVQAIANNLTRWQDILVMNASALTSRDLRAYQLGLDFRFTVWQDVLLEPLLRWYRQTDVRDTALTRTTPGLHVLWRIKDRFSVEAEGDWEISRTNSPVIVDNVRRRFYYVGWRWDL